VLVEYEPDVEIIPGLWELYGIEYDRNHAMKIDTRFMMEQVINPDSGVYREESILANTETGAVPNWLIMFKMQNCYYCDMIMPNMHELAR